jgi:predicted pyridoxine 5'-phosphate oxidase superfamily flavin-nucleotide-binding protein
MSDFYTHQQRSLQDRLETRGLADLLADKIVHSEVPEQHKQFIESRDMFFLATVDESGQPSCSYKGGEPGFVRVVDPRTLAFPSYDGNGMFLSLGNIRAHPQIGMLFIDLEHPHRLRVQGKASIGEHDPLLQEYAGADLMVRVAVTAVFVNCPRYVHRFQRVAPSRYVPQQGCETPFAEWKRIDLVQPVLPPRDQGKAERAGGIISEQDYSEKLARGQA